MGQQTHDMIKLGQQILVWDDCPECRGKGYHLINEKKIAVIGNQRRCRTCQQREEGPVDGSKPTLLQMF